MKQCIKCLSNEVTSVVDGNRIFYHCNSCGEKNSRCLETSGSLQTKIYQGEKVHISVVAIIEKADKILFIKRKDYPYSYCLPVGHVYVGENLNAAIRRKVLEETGLSIVSKKKISSLFIKGKCKLGANLHIWNIYDCQCSGDLIPGFETQETKWVAKNDIFRLDLMDRARFVLEKIGIIDQKTINMEVGPINSKQLLNDNAGPSIARNVSSSLSYLSSIAISDGDLKKSIQKMMEQIVLETDLVSCSLTARDLDLDIRFYKNALNNNSPIYEIEETFLNKKTSDSFLVTQRGDYRILIIPLKFDRVSIGNLVLTKELHQYFNEDEIKTLSSIASKIAISAKQLKTEGDLVREKNMLNTILTNTTNGIILLESLEIIYFNNCARDILEITSKDELIDRLKKLDIYPYLKKLSDKIELERQLNDKTMSISLVSTQGEKYKRLVVINDITELKKKQETIKRENNLLLNVVENTREGIMVTDNTGKVIMINSYFEEVLGINKKDAIGMEGTLFAKKFGAADYAKKLLKAIYSTQQQDWFYDEIELILPGSQKNCFAITTSFIRDSQGKTSHIVMVARNITDEKKLLQTKNDLITTATHELRTPLTAIKGYLSMIKDSDERDMSAKQNKYLDRAYLSTERLVNLVEDLLSALKIEENKVNFELGDFDLGKEIVESIQGLKSKARSKRITVSYKYTPIFAYGDRVKSKHVLENLLDNAIKYTPNNGSIDISAVAQLHNIVISIKDTGVGIPEEQRSMIFEKFTRINNPLSVKAGGTGLGLYIAKNLIEKQGGRIWLESEHKVGTTFHFTLPASTAFMK